MNKQQAERVNKLLKDAQDYPLPLRIACFLKEIHGLTAAEFNRANIHFPLIEGPLKNAVLNGLRDLADRKLGNCDPWYDELWELSVGSTHAA